MENVAEAEQLPIFIDLGIILHDDGGRLPPQLLPLACASMHLCMSIGIYISDHGQLSLEETNLATHGRNAWAIFDVAYRTLEKNDATVSEQPDAAALRSEMQRFQLWAINLGLFRTDHNSLDYRLRDNEIVRSFTRELLTNLTEALEESMSLDLQCGINIDIKLVTSIASSGDEAPSSMISGWPDVDALRAENDELSNVSNDGGSSIGPVMMGTLNEDNETMLTLHFEDVTEAINQMYNLASQIRSPQTRKIRTDVDLFKDVDDRIKSEYIKARTEAEVKGIEQISLQCRKSLGDGQTEGTDLVLTCEDQYLIQRLQKSNHARRQQFEYWRRLKEQSIRAASKAVETVPTPRQHNERLTKILKHDTPSVLQLSKFTPSLLSSFSALPKDVVPGGNTSSYSGTSRGLTIHGPSGEKVEWPNPPVAGPLEKDFECPFCFYLCTSRHSKDLAWRFVSYSSMLRQVEN